MKCVYKNTIYTFVIRDKIWTPPGPLCCTKVYMLLLCFGSRKHPPPHPIHVRHFCVSPPPPPPPPPRFTTTVVNGVLPIFDAKSTDPSLVQHVIDRTSEILQGQVLFITTDQPIYAVCKRWQWYNPSTK